MAKGHGIKRLPRKNQRAKAVRIIAAIEAGEDWQQFHGKRLRYDRELVSIPIGRKWRIIFSTRGEGPPTLVGVYSHSEYNGSHPDK